MKKLTIWIKLKMLLKVNPINILFSIADILDHEIQKFLSNQLCFGFQKYYSVWGFYFDPLLFRNLSALWLCTLYFHLHTIPAQIVSPEIKAMNIDGAVRWGSYCNVCDCSHILKQQFTIICFIEVCNNWIKVWINCYCF